MRLSFMSTKLQSLQQCAKIVAVNLMIFLFLLIVAEILARSVWTVRSCIKSECDFSRITGLKVRQIDRAINIGFSRFDPVLGLAPREGFSSIINAPGWVKNAKLTITQDGFRSNGSGTIPGSSDVLVVGDSFTFGFQVSDSETWPACLERKLGRGVDNGGVFDYGTAQALRRASLKLAEKNYTTLVLSTLVDPRNGDFERDRLRYRDGFPKPAVIHTKNGIELSAVPDPNAPGTKFNPSSVSLAYEQSEMVAASIDRFFPLYNYSGERLTVVHPNAANENEIVDWDLRQFSRFPIKNKLLLLQYGSLDTSNVADVAEERKLILRTASELSLKVIDPITVLRNYKESDLWFMDHGGHHTPLGNEVICSYLFEQGFSKQASTFRSHSPSTPQVKASALDR
jgi:hypothetical protein